jgi:hypothetical protein
VWKRWHNQLLESSDGSDSPELENSRETGDAHDTDASSNERMQVIENKTMPMFLV